VTVLVDLPAVRAGRYAAAVPDDTIAEVIRDLRPLLRGATAAPLPDGIRLTATLDPIQIAGLADEIRGLAGIWPFLHLRLVAELPQCTLDVRGQAEATAFAQVVFGELAA
jgi:hypothetical protein